MKSLRRPLFLLAGILSLLATPASHAGEPLVYVSAFAAGKDGAIHVFRLDAETGQLRQIHRNTEVEHPFFLAVSRDDKYLYSIHAPGKFGGDQDEQVAALAINRQTGELKLLNRQSSRGTASCYLDVDATGKSVLVANYMTGSVASFPVRADGSLGEAATFIQHQGSSVEKSRQAGPHAHSIVVSPDNQFVFAADLGLDQVLCYRLDSAAAKLTPARQPFARTPPGAGPRHLTFHPKQPRMYVINELANSVTMFDHDAKSGLLIERQTISTLPEGFADPSYCADVKITPDGRFLYGTNRGHDSIAAYRLADDGRLTLIEIEPSRGKGPQNLAITPDGRLLLCANMPGNGVVAFRIDEKSGELTPLGGTTEMPSPSCIMIRP